MPGEGEVRGNDDLVHVKHTRATSLPQGAPGLALATALAARTDQSTVGNYIKPWSPILHCAIVSTPSCCTARILEDEESDAEGQALINQL